MNKLTCLSILFLLLLLSVSCKQADVPELEALSIESVELSKDFAYTDSDIIITVNAVGVDSITTRTFLSDNLTIEKGSDTSFKVTSDEDVYAPVILQAYKADEVVTKTIYVTFYKHGVVDRNTVEGIKVNVDKKKKVIMLLGEPEFETVSTDQAFEYMNYISKGISLSIKKSSQVVEAITLRDSNYYHTDDNLIRHYYIDYPYELPYGWKIRQTTMNSVIEELGEPDAKSSKEGSTLRSYRFNKIQSWIRFFSDDEDDYFGKTIISMIIY